MITKEKPVLHQLARRVGLFPSLVCGFGGISDPKARPDIIIGMMAIVTAEPPPRRGQGRRKYSALGLIHPAADCWKCENVIYMIFERGCN